MKHPVALALAALLLCFSSPLRAEEAEKKSEGPATTSAASAKTLVDSLTEPELDDFITQLKDHFIKPDLLSDIEVKRSTVQGLLARLAPGVILTAAPKAGAGDVRPFRSEVIDERIGYLRMGSTTPENVAALDTALAGFVGKKLGSLVLDLRATPAGSEFDQAVEVCRRFVPKGKVLFTVKKANVKLEEVLTSKDDPAFRGIIVVLVDQDTAGAAEVIAAVLRTQVRAMIIGQQTRGEAVEFRNVPLESGEVLRVAVAEVTLPDSAPVFPGGVKPDVPVDMSQATTDEVLAQGLESGVAGLIFETERPRMNEASLVAGRNPDLDAMQAAQHLPGEKPKPPLRDAVLQRAVDFITLSLIHI